MDRWVKKMQIRLHPVMTHLAEFWFGLNVSNLLHVSRAGHTFQILNLSFGLLPAASKSNSLKRCHFPQDIDGCDVVPRGAGRVSNQLVCHAASHVPNDSKRQLFPGIIEDFGPYRGVLEAYRT
jgi:hypothetical protein